MIKKLRRKFILINMITVTLILLAVLFLQCFSSSQRFRRESTDMLHRVLQDNTGFPQPRMDLPQRKEPSDRNFISIFTVVLSADGAIEISQGITSEVSENLAREAVTAALKQDKKEGTLSALSLRYLRDDQDGKHRIAFADMTMEASAMRNLILTSLLIFFGGTFVLFIISYFLARLALKPAQAAWDQQSRFVADASHELKTPLTVILANLKILKDHPDSTIAEQSHWLDNTQKEAARMRKLVENLLFLARSEATTATLPRSVCNISDLLWNCLLPLESMAFDDGILFLEDIQPDLFILANTEQLKQLVIILLDNACKYAGGEKKVSIGLTRTPDKICLTVHNTGTPIPSEELSHLFERFYRSDKSRTRKKDGYGLGLSIAETIVKGHHGKIRVTSDVDTGTTFSVFFPAAAPE